MTQSGLQLTSQVESSLLADTNVLAVPGCSSFPESWSTLFAEKHAFIGFDNDYPGVNKKTEQPIEPAAYAGMKRTCGVLSRANVLPASVSYLKWGADKGYNPQLPDGYDVRDALGVTKIPAMRVKALENLLGFYEPVRKGKDGQVHITPLDCTSWDVLVNSWRKAMKFIEGLDRAFSIMLACVASTTMPDDQLWIKVMSPPGTGKTSLCEGLAIARDQCRSVENFTGLHSGFQTDGEGEEDHSLLMQLKDKTFIIKEADPLLRAVNRDKILAQLRGAYDTNCGTAYGNRVKREYRNHRFTVIMCGTESLLELDAAELGARFLDVIIMKGIDRLLETEINSRIFYRVFRNRGREANGTPETHSEPAMLEAKRLTGGYVIYLRKNAARLLEELDDSNAEELDSKFNALAQFVAFMRARPSKKQEEMSTREMSSRLMAQLSKLALCLAVVMNKKMIDDEVIRRVIQTVMDTSQGKTLEICKWLYSNVGLETRQLVAYTGVTDAKMRDMLRFLATLKVVESYTEGKVTTMTRPKWRLTPQLRELWKVVHECRDQNTLAGKQ